MANKAKCASSSGLSLFEPWSLLGGRACDSGTTTSLRPWHESLHRSLICLMRTIWIYPWHGSLFAAIWLTFRGPWLLISANFYSPPQNSFDSLLSPLLPLGAWLLCRSIILFLVSRSQVVSVNAQNITTDLFAVAHTKQMKDRRELIRSLRRVERLQQALGQNQDSPRWYVLNWEAIEQDGKHPRSRILFWIDSFSRVVIFAHADSNLVLPTDSESREDLVFEY